MEGGACRLLYIVQSLVKNDLFLLVSEDDIKDYSLGIYFWVEFTPAKRNRMWRYIPLSALKS